MKQLYEKDETLFAILCIVVYVVVLGTIRANFGDSSIFSLAALLILAALFLLFIGKNDLWSKYGLTFFPKAKEYLYFVPFLLMGSVNLWNGAVIRYPGIGQVYALVSMALVGFVEEIIFRGFLFKAMEKSNAKTAIIVSAVTFGAGHIINLLTGQASLDTLLQICYAVAIGFSFVLLFFKSKSLLPCILTHSLIDMTSTFCNESYPEGTQAFFQYGAAAFLLLVAVGYSLYLLKKK